LRPFAVFFPTPREGYMFMYLSRMMKIPVCRYWDKEEVHNCIQQVGGHIPFITFAKYFEV
jgi:hypothetical protein